MPSDPSHRPLTARSVIASTLLGMHPPRLPARILVRSGELFGINEGTTRTALSRMLAAGELELDGDGYRLAGPLLARQALQDASRRTPDLRWDETWELAVVRPGTRSAADRAELRRAMAQRKLAERREGVWLRPANLDPDRFPEAAAVATAQSDAFQVRPVGDARRLVAELWDLEAWARAARDLRDDLRRRLPRLRGDDPRRLGDDFTVLAATLRHLLADPQLPAELLPARWPGDGLRAAYVELEAAFQAAFRDWFRAQR